MIVPVCRLLSHARPINAKFILPALIGSDRSLLASDQVFTLSSAGAGHACRIPFPR